MKSRSISLGQSRCVFTVIRKQLPLSHLCPNTRNTSFYARCELAISAVKQCKLLQMVKVLGLQKVHVNVHIKRVQPNLHTQKNDLNESLCPFFNFIIGLIKYFGFFSTSISFIIPLVIRNAVML